MNHHPLRLALSHCEHGDWLRTRGAWGASAALYRLGLQVLGTTLPEPPSAEDEGSVLELRQRLLERIQQELKEAACEHGELLSRIRRWLLGISITLCALLALRLGWLASVERDISEGCAWSASSHSSGAPLSGKLPQRTWTWATPNYFFHTKAEPSPWIQVDLGRIRQVRGIEIVNRIDCCWERAGHVTIETSEDGMHFEEVARRQAAHPARRWDRRFSPRRARWLRVTSSEKTPLHFADLRVFGS